MKVYSSTVFIEQLNKEKVILTINGNIADVPGSVYVEILEYSRILNERLLYEIKSIQFLVKIPEDNSKEIK